ncbi:efflux RND transporter permease subunit [Bradyrhizobium sp. LHD-71]|uniref:efflux RND transporter permease subunit n=1 Tax=Bradyrhizobium sp. LHD-71 TaxID=3072141 RepID=UPI00280E7E6B|nr:efflux RND transporter permease subunit [Bradyrhizobium sp. LHD-71]MDQ8729763.1 efflux RND transporter permease subunit [Bradyrhizobium sp. LHD-71]
MRISDLCIRRPVFATVLSLVVVLVGLVAFSRLAVREYPNIDPPVVLVQTDYRGASAEVIESTVTRVLEESIAGIEGIDYLRSTTRQERSQISIRFKLGRDVEAAANDVRDRVSRVRRRLPTEIDEPVISKVEADAQPVLYLAFSSDRHSPLEITDFADRFVKDRIQSVTGVAEARIFGERRYAMRIWLDAARLAAYALTPQDVENALRAQNVEVPAGRIEGRDTEFTVLAETDLRVPDQFGAIIVKQASGFPVRVRDVARVERGPLEERVSVRFNGKPAVSIGVVKQAVANPLDISKGVRAELPGILEILPEGMSAEVAHDTSVFIQASIDSVFRTIGEAILLVILVVFLFLRNFRATLIPVVTIPASLLGAFAIMYALGFTVNTLTLLAMVLAIGLVVDDAIVVLENIYRHIEEGMSPMAAAFKGSKEIGFAVIAMTLTLAAVYAPIGFMSGTTGRLFTEFAWALAGAVIISGFVALTLSPMMCARMLKHEPKHGFLFNLVERALVGMTSGYRSALRFVLNYRFLVLLGGATFAGCSYFIFNALKPELSPVEDRGTIISFFIGPEGATTGYMNEYAGRIDTIVSKVPEVEGRFVVSGNPIVSQGIAFSRLLPWGERERKQQVIVNSVGNDLKQLPGVLAYANNPPSLGQNASSRPVWITIQSQVEYSELNGLVELVLAEAEKRPELANVETRLKLNKPELKVSVNRERAANVGAEVETIGRTLETMLGGRQVTRFKQNGKQYDVIVQVADVERTNPDDLAKIYVRNAGGQMIQLSNLVELRESVAPRELSRQNQVRSADITANIASGYSQGEAIAALENAVRQVVPSSVQIDYIGQSREFKQASGDIYFTFLLALMFIYLVLAAQFESFIDPFIIMLTVPLSMTGALLALKLGGGTMNIYSQVGLVTLVGLITKNGILIVEFANQLQDEGRSRLDAVVEASALRLRPILMTTSAMVLGAVPLAMAVGAGAESRNQIGLVIVGGLVLGTVLTLFVVPTVYTLLARDRSVKPQEVAAAPADHHPLPAE